ncbi:MAG TPA: GNAT family protein [Candidatus Limnocylindria bacterium]|nr:GNAT family protein [Candidatus Limnocylindria bacterium]
MTTANVGAPTLRGQHVTLRPMTHADAPHLVRWAGDPDFAWFQWGRRPGRFPDDQAARQWIDAIAENRGVTFAIEHEGRPVGQVNYRDLRPKGKSAEVGIGIGEPSLWGRGLGREALGLLVKHLVDDLGLHRITLSVLAYNDRAIASYKASGFEVEGIERDGVMTDRGHWADDVKMAYVVGRARPQFDPRPVTLTGTHLRLEPLRREHAGELFPVAHDEDIWRLMLVPMPNDVASLERWIAAALEEQILGNQIAFITRRVADGAPIGSTRFLHIDRANKTVEIGWTFLGREARRTVANTEAKYLQLRHLFEDLGAHRVWLQTDKLNERSQKAMERIGAIREGEHRDDRISHDGRIRTSVVYGITRSDWPAVEARIRGLLSR